MFPYPFATGGFAQLAWHSNPNMMHALATLFSSRWRVALALMLLAAAALAWKAWSDTMADPSVVRTQIALEGMPEGTSPVRAAFLADIHVAGPDMPPERLARIVEQVNALEPDIVLIAGDLVSEKRTATRAYTAAEIVAPLGKLDSPLGVVVVPGNHDHWFDWDGLRSELHRHGIRVLQNEAAQIGSLAIGGVDDAYTRRDDLPLTLNAMRGLEGGRLILTHSPDILPQVPSDVSLVLAGHTHCGQVAYPWGGSPAHVSRYGERFGCGVIEEGGRKLIVSAGLGTSVLPFRLFTQPEVWLIQLVPQTQKAVEPEGSTAP